MKKHIIYLIAIAIVAVWAGFATTASAIQGKRIKEQHQTIVHQSEVIDSLLNRRMNVFDVSLSVEDRSKLTVYGKKSENLQVPATKTYILKLDSVSVKQLEK
jgi:hypothetical protein